MTKKILSLSLAAIMLCGCGAQGIVNENSEARETQNNIVEPVRTENLLDVFNAEAKDIISSIYKDDPPEVLINVGREIPDIDGKKYKGETVNLNSFKGKNTVIEFIGHWCEYCQDMRRNYMDQIIEQNPDVTFVECFIDGAEKDTIKENDQEVEADTIEKFYEEAGVSPSTEIIIEESEEIHKYAFEELGAEYLPTFIFIDEAGKISWVHEGELHPEQFESIRPFAFDKPARLYEMTIEGYPEPWKYKRTWEDVRNDLSEEIVESINKLNDSEDAQASCYSNILVAFDPNEEKPDINGNLLDMKSLTGMSIYTFFSEYDEDIEKEIDEINALFDEGNQNIITVIIEDKNIEISEFLETLSVYPKGYVFSAGDLPTSLYSLHLNDVPTSIFINEDENMVTGSITGPITYHRLKTAVDVFSTLSKCQ